MKYIIFFCLFIVNFSCNKKQSKTVSENNTEKKTIVYGIATCHYCVDTKTYLAKKNIPFIFYDLETNPKKIAEMHAKLRQANISTANFQIPVVDKGGEIITNDYSSFEVFLSKLN